MKKDIKQGLKFLQSLRIDCAENCEKANALFKTDYERANLIRKKLNDKVAKSADFKKIFLDCTPIFETFLTKQIFKKKSSMSEI